MVFFQPATWVGWSHSTGKCCFFFFFCQSMICRSCFYWLICGESVWCGTVMPTERGQVWYCVAPCGFLVFVNVRVRLVQSSGGERDHICLAANECSNYSSMMFYVCTKSFQVWLGSFQRLSSRAPPKRPFAVVVGRASFHARFMYSLTLYIMGWYIYNIWYCVLYHIISYNDIRMNHLVLRGPTQLHLLGP